MILLPALGIILQSIVLCLGDKDKRLLLDDPTLVNQRLTHLESVIQQLQSNSVQREALVTELRTKVSTLESSIGTLQQQQSSNQGNSLFIHWGSRSCPNTTASQVYSGYAAGGIYTDTGAGIDYICLPDNPIYGSKLRDQSTAVAYIYGAEYQGATNAWGTNSLHEDAPCAVCRSPETTSLMIPGRNVCYSGWTMQYKGYLASGYYAHKAQYNYVCVDEKVDYLRGGANANYGALFYPVVGKCGSLGCPPYKDNQYLSCVVCSK